MTDDMKKTSKPISSMSNVFKALTALTFAVALVFAMTRLHTAEPNTATDAFKRLATLFERHVTSSHWQWRVSNATPMIMLVHYNDEGTETARTPVSINKNGWPTGEKSDRGCEKIWSSLVAAPLNVEEFKIYARFYAEEEKGANIHWCRFSLRSGAYFDYFPKTGSVSELKLN